MGACKCTCTDALTRTLDVDSLTLLSDRPPPPDPTKLCLIVLLGSFSVTPRQRTLNGRYDGCRGYGPQVDTSGTLDEEGVPSLYVTVV